MISLLLPIGILVSAGLITLLSISPHLFFLQLLWAIIGMAIMVSPFFFFDWRIIVNFRWLIGGLYALSVLLLTAALTIGPVIRNARSWLVLGPLSFQPVELAKIALILFYASYFSRRHLAIARWKTLITSFVLFVVPAVLVALQPNLGSALILFGIWFGFLLTSGLPLRRLAVVLLAFAIAGVFMWSYFLRPYQRARIVGILYPETNALGINYSTAQSKIAIGSAGFWGKGYGQGPETQLGFLPVPESDFILAALIEQWGIFGALIVIGSFLFLIFQILKIGAAAEGNFEKFICLGTVIVFGIQFIVNGGSELGFLPVIGVPFPFLSYGGSSLVSNFFLMALVAGIKKHHKA